MFLQSVGLLEYLITVCALELSMLLVSHIFDRLQLAGHGLTARAFSHMSLPPVPILKPFTALFTLPGFLSCVNSLMLPGIIDLEC